MNQEIINKLHTVLYTISPLASERTRIIEEMGDVIWFESLEKMLLSLPEDIRNGVVELLNNEDVEKALEIIEVNNVDVESIFEEVSKNVLNEVLSSTKEK